MEMQRLCRPPSKGEGWGKGEGGMSVSQIMSIIIRGFAVLLWYTVTLLPRTPGPDPAVMLHVAEAVIGLFGGALAWNGADELAR
jgi:hypothetical protein